MYCFPVIKLYWKQQYPGLGTCRPEQCSFGNNPLVACKVKITSLWNCDTEFKLHGHIFLLFWIMFISICVIPVVSKSKISKLFPQKYYWFGLYQWHFGQLSIWNGQQLKRPKLLWSFDLSDSAHVHYCHKMMHNILSLLILPLIFLYQCAYFIWLWINWHCLSFEVDTNFHS